MVRRGAAYLWAIVGAAFIAHGAWLVLTQPPEHGAFGFIWGLFGLAMQSVWVRPLIRRRLKLAEPQIVEKSIAEKSIAGRVLVLVGLLFMPVFFGITLRNMPTSYPPGVVPDDPLDRAFNQALPPTIACVGAGLWLWSKEQRKR